MGSLKNALYRALRSSERVFKTDMVYLARGGFWLVTSQVLVAAASFGLSVAFAHLFPKEAFGNYRYVIAVAGVISIISLTGLGTAVTQSAARGFKGALKAGFLMNLRWSYGIVFVSFGIAAYYFFRDNALLGYSLVLIGLATPILNGSSLFASYLTGTKEFAPLSLINAARNIFPALTLVFALLVRPEPGFIILTYFVAHSVAAFIAYLWVQKRYAGAGADPDMGAYAKHLSFVGALNTLAEQLDKIIVFQFIGATPLAIYTFATALPLQVRGMLRNVYPLALSKFAERPFEETKRVIFRKTFQFFLMTIPVVILYILVAPYIYRIFFPQYLESVHLSQVFALSILGMASVIPATLLQARKMVSSLYKLNLAMAVAKLSFLALGTWLWGIWGLVAARIAYEYAGLAIALFITKFTHEKKPAL